MRAVALSASAADTYNLTLLDMCQNLMAAPLRGHRSGLACFGEAKPLSNAANRAEKKT